MLFDYWITFGCPVLDRALAAMASGQAAIGEQQFMQMFVVALTIAAGLLIGNTIVKSQASQIIQDTQNNPGHPQK